jgi:hypothetical protein
LFDNQIHVDLYQIEGMAKQIVPTQPGASFEYELLEDDPEHLITVVVASSSQRSPWIEPSKLKLRHRIGRGPFGDVWLATHHQSTEDYDEFHEVAVKMLQPIKEEHTRALLDKFEDLFSKCQGVGGVCWLHGVSIISGKVECLYLYLMPCGPSGEIVLSDIKVAKE